MCSRSHPNIRRLSLLASLLALGCTPIDGPKAHSGTHDGGALRDHPQEVSAASETAGDAAPSDAKEDPQRMRMTAAAASTTSPDAGATQQAAADASAPSNPENQARPERSRDALPLNQIEMPGETADAEALQALSQWNKLPVFAAASRHVMSSTDRGVAAEMNALAMYEDGNRDLNNFICKSQDAKLGTPTVSYIFDLAQCEEDYVHGVELARFEGSGRMTRLWFSASTPSAELSLSDELLRIYVDDNPRPLLQARLSDAHSGTAGEIFATPFGSAAKSSMTWYYPVVFSTKLVVAIDNLKDMYFYEVEAALDDQPKQRWAPLERLPERDAAHARLAAPSPLSATDKSQKVEHLSLGAGERKDITLDGPATTNELRLRVPTAKLAALQPVNISVKWDQHDGSAIDVPLLALFASRSAPPEKSSLALSATLDANDSVLSLRLPMPFQTEAAWTLTNSGSEAVEFDLTWSGAADVPNADFGNLHVQTFETSLPAKDIEQTVAQLSSRGRLVGVCFDIAGDAEVSTVREAYNRPLFFSSGDINFAIDGAPSKTFATSTDTYNDDAFNFKDAPHSTAFTQSWNLQSDPQKEPQGQVSLCRWHVLGNELDFAQDLKLTRELAQRDTSYVRLNRSIAYYYAQRH